jgi:hypothetical protein
MNFKAQKNYKLYTAKVYELYGPKMYEPYTTKISELHAPQICEPYAEKNLQTIHPKNI